MPSSSFISSSSSHLLSRPVVSRRGSPRRLIRRIFAACAVSVCSSLVVSFLVPPPFRSSFRCSFRSSFVGSFPLPVSSTRQAGRVSRSMAAGRASKHEGGQAACGRWIGQSGDSERRGAHAMGEGRASEQARRADMKSPRSPTRRGRAWGVSCFHAGARVFRSLVPRCFSYRFS